MKKKILKTLILIFLIANSFLLKAQSDTLEIYVENSVRLTLIVRNAKKISEIKQVDSLFRAFEQDFMIVKDTFFINDKENYILYQQKKEPNKKKKTGFSKEQLSSLTIEYKPISERKCFIDDGNYISSDKFLHSAYLQIDKTSKLIFSFNNIDDFKYLKNINIDKLITDINDENKDFKLRKKKLDFCKYTFENNKITEKYFIKEKKTAVIQFYPSSDLYALNGELVPNVNYNLELLTISKGKNKDTYGIKLNSFFYYDRPTKILEMYPYIGVYFKFNNFLNPYPVTVELSHSLINNDDFYSQSNFLEKNSLFWNISTPFSDKFSINYSVIFKIKFEEQPVNQSVKALATFYFGVGIRYNMF